MNDLISRKDAIDAMMALKQEDDEEYGCEIPEGFDGKRAVEALEKLPSAEPERTAKVIEHDASVTDTDGYKYHRSEYLCGACKKKVIGGDDYCSHCGARLEWE